ncbi:hypothetical protein [Vulcanisaeta thermophila]|uniref:hypothetical protein n=1 Tax=Vulcanisaeta thermophila TaxID=867917 RepID=UPI0008538A96|nr:hypothetical protein [Vulcanisaeta thermophila]
MPRLRRYELRIGIEHYGDWSQATRDFRVVVKPIFYFPQSNNLMLEVLRVYGDDKNLLKDFIMRFKYLNNIYSVIGMYKVNDHEYELVF